MMKKWHPTATTTMLCSLRMIWFDPIFFMMLTHNDSTNCNYQNENLSMFHVSHFSQQQQWRWHRKTSAWRRNFHHLYPTSHTCCRYLVSYSSRGGVMASSHQARRFEKAERDCRVQFWLSPRRSELFFVCSCLIRVEEDEVSLNVILSHNFFFVAYRRCCATQVQTVSISYLRCLMEHVRSYILDRDIELVYYTIRKSSDVLTRDPMQLGAQVCVEIGFNRISSLSGGKKESRNGFRSLVGDNMICFSCSLFFSVLKQQNSFVNSEKVA